ncbi:5108_t:CDS:1, partial [Funneliformis mosseae]
MSMDMDNNIEILTHSNDSNILSAHVNQIQELMFTFSSQLQLVTSVIAQFTPMT